MAIGNFIIANEEGAQHRRSRTRACRSCKVGNAFDPMTTELQEDRSATPTSRSRKGFGVKDPARDHRLLRAGGRERWRPVSKGIGRDVDKFTDVLNSEIYSKVDPEKL